ncbi:hypothetical protein OsJ_17283 [Oryza sativa Japonica Group]|uniref:UspA domain-containing protein n=1 Tax=Oryza sativa subsp. japonica TaxID=39947 RepID=B9FHY5_ORYSJ|nr:hypothetical protein OsJ_17283 [Oryza sativa Japonica Group]
MIPLVELADPRVSRIYGVAPDAETIGILTSAANQKGVEVVAKVYWGEPGEEADGGGAGDSPALARRREQRPRRRQEASTSMHLYLSLVLMGSVSTYVANHATCPVTVVRENLPPPPPPPQPPQPVATAASYY